MEIKDIIRNKRLERGYTMKQLGDKVGVSEATVSRWESGHLSTMKHTKIALLAEALGISPVLLFAPAQPAATATTAKAIDFSEREMLLIKKYRQLDADGQEDVEDFVNMKLAKALRKAEEAMTAEEKEEALG